MREANEVFNAIRTHLRALSGRLECFGRYEFQAAAWLKGELITLLDGLKERGEICGLDREIKTPTGGKIDLAFDLPGGRHWIELKHWLIGKQKGQTWKPKAYVSDLENELEKLQSVRAGERGWLVILCTANPGAKALDEAIQQSNRDNAPRALGSEDAPVEYPASYFVGVLRAKGLAA